MKVMKMMKAKSRCSLLVSHEGYDDDESHEGCRVSNARGCSLKRAAHCPDYNIRMESCCILSCRQVVAEIVVSAFA
jgi:hypothetical protein